MDYDPTRADWSIMTKTRGGKVSLMKGLTLDEVKKIYNRLDPDYGRREYMFDLHPSFERKVGISGRCTSRIEHYSDSDIVMREVFGPYGWNGFTNDEIEKWPKYKYIYIDDNNEILPDEYQDHIEVARLWRRDDEREKAENLKRQEKIEKERARLRSLPMPNSKSSQKQASLWRSFLGLE